MIREAHCVVLCWMVGFVMTLPVELRQGRFLFMVKDVLVIQVELWIVKGL